VQLHKDERAASKASSREAASDVADTQVQFLQELTHLPELPACPPIAICSSDR